MPFDPTPAASITGQLREETEQLLTQRTRDIRLSPEMMIVYRKATWTQRNKIARSWMVWITAMGALFVPISLLLAPDHFWHTACVGWLAIPGLNTYGYLVWRKQRSAFTEGLSLVLMLSGMMLASGWLGAAVGNGNYERFLTATLYVTTIAIALFNVGQAWTLALMAGPVSIFLGFEIFNPAVDAREAIGTTIFYAMGIYSVTNARRAQSLLSKKSFLLSLRDRYRSDALKTANQQLELLATRDPLTGLANRRSAADRIEALWQDPAIVKSQVAFIMADIDSFKRLNDSAGHAAGDDCIRQVARTIEASLRSNDDMVCRYGGEEFLVVLTDATADLAWMLADRIRCAVAALGLVNPGIEPADGVTGIVTISLGVALARDDVAPELVAKWADDALYDAKRAGRNAVFLSTGEAQEICSDRAIAASRIGPGPSLARIAPEPPQRSRRFFKSVALATSPGENLPEQ